MKTTRILLASIFLVLTSCSVSEPEGPGEQIGKGIDLITKGLSNYDQENEERLRLQREEDEKRRRQIEQGREHYERDPYDPQRADDWSSERRY